MIEEKEKRGIIKQYHIKYISSKNSSRISLQLLKIGETLGIPIQ